MLAIGRKVIWPGSSVGHWEIRKGFTISEYSSKTFANMMQSYNELDKKLCKNPILSMNSYFGPAYKASSLGFIESRLSFYSTSLPAASYRRTSLDFRFQPVEDFCIGAFVNNDKPDTILINLGTLIAVEDASQALLALWDIPIGVSFPVIENTLLKLRVEKDGLINTFVDYSSGYYLDDELSNKSSACPSNDELLSKIPNILKNSFLLLSTSLNRQVFADNLSTMSLLWIIAHEDAHRYCGHLIHFQELGISEQDRLFDELICSVDSNQQIHERRSAELEADTCATTRAVDYCFESEFLGFFTDYLSLEAKEQVWEERKESLGLGRWQRLFLMRLISISSILPIAIFECAVSSNPSNNFSCYPSFFIRSLNVIFTVASRAMDVSLQRADENRVGEINILEFESFFSFALEDLSSIFTIISNCVNSRSGSRLGSLMPNKQRLVTALLTSFLACHGQFHLLGITRKLKREDFGDDTQIIVDFIRERQIMYLSSVEVFASSKKLVNLPRIDKVYDDIEIAMERIRIARDIFDFL